MILGSVLILLKNKSDLLVLQPPSMSLMVIVDLCMLFTLRHEQRYAFT